MRLYCFLSFPELSNKSLTDTFLAHVEKQYMKSSALLKTNARIYCGSRSMCCSNLDRICCSQSHMCSRLSCADSIAGYLFYSWTFVRRDKYVVSVWRLAATRRVCYWHSEWGDWSKVNLLLWQQHKYPVICFHLFIVRPNAHNQTPELKIERINFINEFGLFRLSQALASTPFTKSCDLWAVRRFSFVEIYVLSIFVAGHVGRRTNLLFSPYFFVLVGTFGTSFVATKW